MLKPGLCFYDSTGKSHPSAKAAALAEIAAILGYTGSASGVASALALLVYEKRAQIETVFAQFDAMTVAFGTDGD
jgi:3-methyladenine DNA glycosylase Tag